MDATGTTHPAERQTSSPEFIPAPASLRRLGPMDVLALSAWCGLAAGWLEVGTRMLFKSMIGTNRLYLMSRHFVWLVPLTYLLLFSGIGLFLALATKLCPRPAGWLSPRLICALGYPAGAHDCGPSDLHMGLVDPGVGHRDASGPVAREVPRCVGGGG